METTMALKGLELASPVSSHHLLTNQAIPHHKNDEFRTSSVDQWFYLSAIPYKGVSSQLRIYR